MSLTLERGTRLVVATHNPGKARELAEILEGRFILVAAGELGLPEPDETETTFVGNALLKARAAADASGLVALADDSGLSVKALGGAPGIYSARWAGPEKDFGLAIRNVEARLEEAAATDPSAWFTCALVLAWPDGHEEGFEGKAKGAWVWPPRGAHGFGYDPMFVPSGLHETFGEMDPVEKHRISHRAAAFALLAASCLPPVAG
jgi:XTP/dITP diphosphohydrolase